MSLERLNMDSSFLISVIVPVYQSKAILRFCIDSILNQTYRNLEIILVYDGSTDGSGETCDSFAKCDSRVIVIQQTNRGISGTRNTESSIANEAA